MPEQSLRYEVNCLQDGTVVTKDGEFLGSWGTDESDVIYQFTPDGGAEPLLIDPFMGPLCEKILKWHESRNFGL